MKLVNLETVLSTTDNIVIEFIPKGQGSKFWAWKFGDLAQVETLYG